MLKIAAALQFTAYGIPSVFYGDEIGLEGYGDPFCRMPMPWHEIGVDYRADLLEFYRRLGHIRKTEKAFDGGDFYVVKHTESAIVFVREREDSRIIVAANRGGELKLAIPEGSRYLDLLGGEEYSGNVAVKPDSVLIMKEILKK